MKGNGEVLVGVHIRRADFESYLGILFNVTVFDETFFLKAMGQAYEYLHENGKRGKKKDESVMESYVHIPSNQNLGHLSVCSFSTL